MVTEIKNSELRTLSPQFLSGEPSSTLPSGWRWVRLGEVLKEPLKNGLNYSKEDFGKGLKFVNISDIFCPNIIDTTKLDRINVSSKDIEKYQLRTGDILIVRSSLKREGVAYPALFKEDKEPVVFCGFLIRIRPDKEKVEPLYLLKYLRSSTARERLIGDSGTVTITNVDQGTILSLNIPLPPLHDQLRIAAKLQEFMKEISNLKSAISKQLEAAKALPSAYLREVFQSDEAKKWERKRLGEVCEKIIGGGTPSRGRPEYWGGSIYWLSPSELEDDKLNYVVQTKEKITEDGSNSSNAKIIPSKSVMLSCTASVGKVAINEVPLTTNQQFNSFVLKDSIVIPKFVAYYLLYIKEDIKQMGGKTTFTFISKDEIADIFIPLPALYQQHNIATYLKEKMAHVENLQSKIYNQQSALNALPQAVLKKAFKGEL